MSDLPAKLSAKHKERTKNGWRIYQYLCIGDTKCVAFLDQGESLHQNPELKAQWEQELKDFRFEKRGGRILWDIDAGGMNCHSYGCFMVGIPGISTDMMLSPTENRLFKNATFDDLLKNFFDLTPAKSVGRLQFDEWLAANAKDGDLLLYYDGDEVIHTGVVNVRKDSQGAHYVIESKLGNGPVVEASAELTYDYYAEATAVRLARVKNSGHH